LLAQQLRKGFVAKSSPGGDCIVAVMAPMVGSFGAERDSHSHLGHHRGAAAADKAAVGKKDLTAAASRFDRRIHACGAGSDHQDVGFGLHRLLGHDDLAAVTIAALASSALLGPKTTRSCIIATKQAITAYFSAYID
jgi:hypothetical protein